MKRMIYLFIYVVMGFLVVFNGVMGGLLCNCIVVFCQMWIYLGYLFLIYMGWGILWDCWCLVKRLFFRIIGNEYDIFLVYYYVFNIQWI